jgi:DNA polymerase-3 subunit delta
VPPITAALARKQIAAGTPAPVYLIVGDDDQEIAALVAEFATLVEEPLRPFNVERIHAGDRGRDTGIAAVESARVLPMMAPRRVVFLLRAERLLKPKGRRGARLEADADDEGEPRADPGGSGALEEYVASPEPLTTLVVVAADVNKALRPVKALYRHASVVECWGLKTGRDAKSWDLPGIQRKAESWLRQAAAAADGQIDADAARLLAERAGADISRLRGDFERLRLYVGDRRRMTRADAEAVVGAETSHDAWAVTTAIERGDTAEALRQLALLLDAGAVPYMVLGQLAWFVREKLPHSDERRVPVGLSALFRTDLDLKSSGGDPRVLLERLVVELCTGAGAATRGWTPGRASGRR